MREAQYRRWLRRELAELGVDRPLSVQQLCTALGDRRGRPIRVVPFSLKVPGPYGMWFSSAEADYIVVQAETSRPHQDHIILHEIGHILHNHQPDDEDPEYVHSTMPSLNPDMIRRSLRRTNYDSTEEQQAELAATILLEWTSQSSLAPDPVRDDRLQRLNEGLGDRPGWL
ncbi:Zn-dependent peptidase ImmA (M78 family) [Crossiella equi]|uniref:Zn-dependent peptidase ImmA (M78 family) n=1 Tax=Crossiella equi TaxID=130796 RepID=A0ABS5AM43_9PSEU|nr:ImmA/IrrE family metallo-endopeptidase [Crossiella equi]MBP2477638.1 Zn-dependent peptidase ImmA (M78 family) [Crossiella equi]